MINRHIVISNDCLFSIKTKITFTHLNHYIKKYFGTQFVFRRKYNNKNNYFISVINYKIPILVLMQTSTLFKSL